jgi:hypothetical protein
VEGVSECEVRLNWNPLLLRHLTSYKSFCIYAHEENVSCRLVDLSEQLLYVCIVEVTL